MSSRSKITSAPPESIGESIQIVREKVADICAQDESIGNFIDMYPGHDNSLDNLLILGPYGTGKTALIREFAYNDSIATLQLKASELLSMWYGVAEQNPTRVFQFAHDIFKKTWKRVFILIDEFDQLMKMSNSSGWNQGESIQTELQILLDGVQEYPGVHIVGLSNKPEKFPAAMIRRMDTVVTMPLSQKEKVSLIKWRLENVSIDQSLSKFLDKFETEISIEDLEAKVALWYLIHKQKEYEGKGFGNLSIWESAKVYWEFITEVWNEVSEDEIFDKDLASNPKISQMPHEEKQVYRYLLASTPKILASITERAFLMLLEEKKQEFWEVEMKKLNTKLWKYKTLKSKQKLLLDKGFTITFTHLYNAAENIFENPTIQSQIVVNREFYSYLRSIGIISDTEAE